MILLTELFRVVRRRVDVTMAICYINLCGECRVFTLKFRSLIDPFLKEPYSIS